MGRLGLGGEGGVPCPAGDDKGIRARGGDEGGRYFSRGCKKRLQEEAARKGCRIAAEIASAEILAEKPVQGEHV